MNASSLTERPEGSFLLYPRLPREAGRALLLSQSATGPSALRAEAALEHPLAAPAPTGGTPASLDDLAALQATVRDIAERAGYPEPLRRGSEQQFDRPCGTALFRVMNAVPADVASEDVWTFVSVVMLPEVGPWRFPDRTEERLLGRPRNVFRRLWWRAWALGPDLEAAPTGCSPLGEDEFVGIMERPSIGGDPRLARAVRDAVWRVESAGIPLARSEVAREITRRFRAFLSHVCVEALDDSELEDLLDEVARTAVAAFEQPGTVPPPTPAVVTRARSRPRERTTTELVEIHANYKGERIEGLFHQRKGAVEIVSGALAGRVFDRPSPAARAVVQDVSPDVNAERNGWVFWTVTSSGRPLQTLR